MEGAFRRMEGGHKSEVYLSEDNYNGRSVCVCLPSLMKTRASHHSFHAFIIFQVIRKHEKKKRVRELLVEDDAIPEYDILPACCAVLEIPKRFRYISKQVSNSKISATQS